MSKKLLSEAQVRRFARLANLSPVNEDWGSKAKEYKRHDDDGVETKSGDVDGHYKDYEGPTGGNKGDDSKTHPGRKDYMKEDAFEDEAEMGLDAAEGELDGAEIAGLEGEAGDAEDAGEAAMDLGSREELAMDVISAVADALNIEVDIEGGEEADDLDAAADLDVADDLDADALADEEEAIMEALRGINYIPGRKEIVNEVAKRVARRLLKAKQADQQLKEALGTKRRK